MATLKVILEILRSMPALISLAREIWEALSDLKDDLEKKERAKKLAEGVKDAREKKDTRKLEDFFGKTNTSTDSNSPDPGSE